MDTSKFLGKFKDATLEHLQRMNAILLRLESQPDAEEDVQELMREVHTLKGESRMMGFGDLADISHALEDVLKAQEKGGFRDLARVADEMFRTLDEVERLLGERLGQGPSGVDVAERCAQLGALAAGAPPPDAAEPAGVAASMPPDAGTTSGASASDADSFGAIDLDGAEPPEDEDWEAPVGHQDSEAAMREAFGVPQGEVQELVAGSGGRLTPAVTLGASADRLRGRFRDTSLSRLHRVRVLVIGLESRPEDADDLRELKQELDALAAEARGMGVDDVALAARALREIVDEAAEDPRLLATGAELALGTVDAMQAVVEAPSYEERLVAALRDAVAAARRGATGESLAGGPHAAHVPPPVRHAPSTPTAAPHRARSVDPALAATLAESIAAQLESLRATSRPGEPPSARDAARLFDAIRSDARVAGLDDAARLAAEGSAAAAAEAPASDLAAALEALERLASALASGQDGSAHLAAGLAVLEAPAVPRVEAPPGAHAAVAPPREASAPAPAPPQAARVQETVRVSLERLESLGHLSGDIYLNHARAEERQRKLRALVDLGRREGRAAARLREALAQGGRGGVAEGGVLHDSYEDMTDAHRQLLRGLSDLIRAERDEHLRVGHAIIEMRERVRELQMVPASTLFDMYPRMVRDIARTLRKKVRLVIEGADVELDRKVLDEIRDPLLHLLRNAVDHGVEGPDVRERSGKPGQGTVRLIARAEGDHVVVEVADDGSGIDPEGMRAASVRKGLLTRAEAEELTDEAAINLIFTAGFSSRDEVSDLSGRGVGLDVVRDRVERLEGRLGVWSEPGRGTRLSMRLPLTLALARVLLIRSGGLLVAVPSTTVEEVLRVDEEEIRRVEAYEVLDWGDRVVPLVSLSSMLGRDTQDPGAQRTVVILSFEDHLVGFVVDDLEGEREVVLKRLDPFLGRVQNVAGATILSSGEVVVVLHVPQLIASTTGVAPIRLHARLDGEAAPARRRATRVLVVDDSIIVRDMMKGVLEAAGFDVSLAVDGVDGLEKQLTGAHDLVITDIEMPRMDGFELTRSLKQNAQQGDVPVVIVTTVDTVEAREKGMRAGASAYLVKNLLDMSQLVTTIQRLVGA